jgi:GNAT superfamily N-acetyltransferase
MEPSNSTYIEIPEIIIFKKHEYKFYSLCDEYCYLECTFVGCKGNIRHFFDTKENFSWGIHSSKCRKQKSNNDQLASKKKEKIKKNVNDFKILKLEELSIAKTEKKEEKIDILSSLNINYQTVQINIDKAKKLYSLRFPTGAKSLIKKLNDHKGKTLGIFIDGYLASSVSYVEWKINTLQFKEIVLLATDEMHGKKGLAKHLMAELMLLGKVAAWSDIGALEFYKKLGFVEDNVLGWELANKISFATFSVFVHNGISEEERIKLIG